MNSLLHSPQASGSKAKRANLRSDRFDEAAKIGLDQLLTVRLAQLCGEAPSKAVGKGDPGPIPNQRPIARSCESFPEIIFLPFLIFMGAMGLFPAYHCCRCSKQR